MKRLLVACALALPMIALTAGSARAEVKTREKSQVKIEGMIGRVVNLFGGKAAKEGIVSTTAVKGNRKATMNDSTGQIIDLSEEKVYDLDLKKQTYKVSTFEQLRQQMREAKEKAEKNAQKEQGKEQKADQSEPQRELEVDFDVKETGQKKQLAGYDAHEVIMTVALREKGKTLEDSGGFVMTADSWLGPQIAALKEIAQFDLKFWKALQGPDALGMSAEQMATVMAMYPQLKQASDRLSKEKSKLQGTPLATTTTFEVVKSKEQMAQQSESSSSGGSGLGGMLARRIAKKDSSEKSPRATIFTVFGETQEIATTVAAADINLPAGFKEKN